MSEDRLERALQAMNEESVDAGTLEAARGRVWQNMANAGSATCAEFRPDFPAYLGKALGDSRRILVEDHLSRCPACRARVAEMKGERTIVAMPRRASSGWTRWAALGAAAARTVSGALCMPRTAPRSRIIGETTSPEGSLRSRMTAA